MFAIYICLPEVARFVGMQRMQVTAPTILCAIFTVRQYTIAKYAASYHS